MQILGPITSAPVRRRLFLRVLLGLFVLGALCGTAWAQEERGLGERPPTPAEAAYIKAVYTRVDRVEPNALARARVAAEGPSGYTSPQSDTALPTAVDNSALPAFPPIGSQGAQGSCTAWAAAYYYDTYTQASDEGYDVSGGDDTHICSPAFLYPLMNGGTDSGASGQYAVALLDDIGACSLALKPYSASDWTSWPSEAAWINALQNRTQSAYTITANNATGLAALKQHLANGNVAVTTFTVYSTWYYYYPADKVGINNGVYYYPDGSSLGGHAVTLVGYDDAKSYVDHRDGQTHYGAFLAANSWGSGWGVANTAGHTGFFWIAYTMFTEGTFGPDAYYNSDRPHYRPSLYAVTGINLAQRGYLWLWGGVDGSPAYQSPYVLTGSGGTSLAVTDANRIAIDLTDGVAGITSTPPSTAYVGLLVLPMATGSATVTSADFYEDFDGDGTYTVHHSGDPTVTVSPGSEGYAYGTLHNLTVAAAAPSPSTVASGGSAALSASYADSEGHPVQWSWSDHGAGGSFNPSAAVRNPTYSAPAGGPSGRAVTLTVTLTCTGPKPLTTQSSTALTVQPGTHSLAITALPPNPATVPSGGAASLSATFVDGDGDSIASWSWSDTGAGGSFSPSANVQSPTYTAPVNGTDTDQTVTLTVSGTCDGASPLTESDSVTLTVQPVAHQLAVHVSAPASLASGATGSLTGSAEDSRGHTIAAWSWSDGGAGGSFSPSASVQNPTYTAPANSGDADLSVTLTLTATCSGSSPLTASGSTTVTVTPVAHTLTVTPTALPSSVASGGTSALSAAFSDSRSGHTAASWSWSDGGAGGSFSPSASVPNPTYTALPDLTDSSRAVTLTATATCSGSSPLTASGATTLTVQPVAHTLTVTAEASAATLASGGTTNLTAAAADSRGHALLWSWSDSGAGGSFSPSATVQSPTYTAPANSTGDDRTVVVTVTVACDAAEPLQAQHQVTLTVQPTVTAAFDVSPESGALPLSVTFTDQSTGHPTWWQWQYGDGATSSEESPTHEYRKAGRYTVVLTAGSDVASDSVTRERCVTATFTDVPLAPAPYWAAAEIIACAGRDIVQGYPDFTYHPEQSVARDQMAVFISRALAGGEAAVPTGPATATFADVPTDDWAAKYVEYCAAKHIVSGYPDGLYHPGDAVGRGDMAVYISRAIASPTGDAGLAAYTPPVSPSFSDVATDFWAYKYVEYAHAKGIVNGYPDGSYQPAVTVTRDQMAVYIARAFALPL